VKKDYRTWWRKGVQVHFYLVEETCYVPFPGVLVDFRLTNFIYEDILTQDCMREQVWAIEQGFAESPGSSTPMPGGSGK
jgi:hypothetical protein